MIRIFQDFKLKIYCRSEVVYLKPATKINNVEGAIDNEEAGKVIIVVETMKQNTTASRYISALMTPSSYCSYLRMKTHNTNALFHA